MLSKVPKMPSVPRRQGTPVRAHLQLTGSDQPFGGPSGPPASMSDAEWMPSREHQRGLCKRGPYVLRSEFKDPFYTDPFLTIVTTVTLILLLIIIVMIIVITIIMMIVIMMIIIII